MHSIASGRTPCTPRRGSQICRFISMIRVLCLGRTGGKKSFGWSRCAIRVNSRSRGLFAVTRLRGRIPSTSCALIHASPLQYTSGDFRLVLVAWGNPLKQAFDVHCIYLKNKKIISISIARGTVGRELALRRSIHSRTHTGAIRLWTGKGWNEWDFLGLRWCGSPPHGSGHTIKWKR